MQLYLIHAGYYDPEIMEGLYEHHTNYFVVAKNVKDAKNKARKNSTYKRKKMHIDGIQQLKIIDGYRIKLIENNSADKTVIYRYDDVENLK